MKPGLRRLFLTGHIVTSVGWLGAVAGFLALSIAGLMSKEPETIRAAYLGMDLIGRSIIVPLSLAALATGLVQSLGTEWGLLRYYWVFVKFLLTMVATFVLLLHQFTAVAEAARRVSGPGWPDPGRIGLQLVGDAGFGLLFLVVITALSVFKPWGKTPFARPGTSGRVRTRTGLPLGIKVMLALIATVVAVFVWSHLTGNAPGHHGP